MRSSPRLPVSALAMGAALLYPTGMHARVSSTLIAAILLAAPCSAQMAALERAVADSEARAVRTGVAICDRDGRVLYRNRAAEAFAPASNMKLLTATGVVHGLGSDFQFVTKFRVVAGELLVQASGDPNWLRETPNACERVFANLARELRARDVTKLRAIVLDPGSFTGPERPATWPQNQLHTYYCAPTGAFVLEQGVFRMAIERSGGSNARIELLAPPAGYEVRGSVREVAAKKGAVYGAIDQGGSIRVRGKFYRKSPRVEFPTAVKDPTRWFEDTMIAQLAMGGVRINKDARVVSKGVVYEHKTRLAEALRRMLEDSSNFDAEQCLRVLGQHTRKDGSLSGGREALHDVVIKLVGEMPAGVVIADGSGLSKENRLTPGLLVVAMYRAMANKDQLGASMLRESMPIAGRTGTLRNRFVGTDLVDRVRAKTGWIRGASSLSGFVELPDGSERWFSILMNYDRGRNGLNKHLKKLQEDIVHAVVGIASKQ